MKTFRFAFDRFKKYLGQATFYFITIFFVVLMSLGLVLISRYVLDYVINPTSQASDLISKVLVKGRLGEVGSAKLLTNLCLIFVGIVLLKAILQYIGEILSQNYAHSYAKDLRNEIMRKMFLRGSFYSTGDIYLMYVNDVGYTRELFRVYIPKLFEYSLYVVSALIMIFITHWMLGVFVLASLPFIIILNIRYVKSTLPYFPQIRKSSRKLSTQITEDVEGIVDIKVNAYENGAIANLERRNNEYYQAKSGCIQKSNKYQMLFMLLRAIFYGGSIILSGFLAINGIITIGAFSVGVSYVIVMFDNVSNSAVKIFQIQESLAYCANIREYIQRRDKISNNKTKEDISGKIDIQATKLSYSSQDSYGLNSLNFDIKSGSNVGFWFRDEMGINELGKLLLKKVEPTSGGISINSKDYKEINIESIRNAISYHEPTTFLFNSTIKDNIILFQEFDEERYQKILEITGLNKHLENFAQKDLSVISHTNQGYPEIVRQLIGVARVLYRDTPVLILDQPMLSVKEKEACAIISKIFKNYKKSTVVVVSENLQLLKNCDTIYVIDDSSIVDNDKYKNLMEKYKD